MNENENNNIPVQNNNVQPEESPSEPVVIPEANTEENFPAKPKSSNKLPLIIAGCIILVIAAAAAVLILTGAFRSEKGSNPKPGTSQSKTTASDGKVKSDSQIISSDSLPSADTAPATPENSPEPVSPPETKYGNAEIYTTESGNDAAKTESGVEVEITGENLGILLEKYQAVQGTGSEEEKELLDQIQLILEASQMMQ